MDRTRLTTSDLATADDGTLHGRAHGSLVTMCREGHTWHATAWPEDGRASVVAYAQTPDEALGSLMDMLEKRI